jgi:anti-anti-sigma factor
LTTKDGLLTIRVDERSANWSVAVLGELDDVNAGTLEAELRRLDGNKPIGLDFSRLEFMSGAGVELLLRLASDAARGNRRVEVVKSSRAVERLLSVCDLDTAGPALSDAVSSSEHSALGTMGLVQGQG